jgi:hypothetical protein
VLVSRSIVDEKAARSANATACAPHRIAPPCSSSPTELLYIATYLHPAPQRTPSATRRGDERRAHTVSGARLELFPARRARCCAFTSTTLPSPRLSIACLPAAGAPPRGGLRGAPALARAAVHASALCCHACHTLLRSAVKSRARNRFPKIDPQKIDPSARRGAPARLKTQKLGIHAQAARNARIQAESIEFARRSHIG